MAGTGMVGIREEILSDDPSEGDFLEIVPVAPFSVGLSLFDWPALPALPSAFCILLGRKVPSPLPEMPSADLLADFAPLPGLEGDEAGLASLLDGWLAVLGFPDNGGN